MQMWSRQMTISLEFKEEIGLESSACRMNLNQVLDFTEIIVDVNFL